MDMFMGMKSHFFPGGYGSHWQFQDILVDIIMDMFVCIFWILNINTIIYAKLFSCNAYSKNNEESANLCAVYYNHYN